MDQEIAEIVKLLGVTPLQAYRHVKARQEIARRRYREDFNYRK